MTSSPDPKRPSHGRRSYLIDPPFQLRFVGTTLLVAFLVLAVIYVSNAFFILKFMKIGQELSFPEGHPFFHFLREQQRVLDQVFLWTGLAVGLGLFVGGIFLSNRIAGPIYRLDSHIKRILETGEWSEVQFRSGDYFPQLADHINSLIRHGRDRKTEKADS